MLGLVYSIDRKCRLEVYLGVMHSCLCISYQFHKVHSDASGPTFMHKGQSDQFVCLLLKLSAWKLPDLKI